MKLIRRTRGTVTVGYPRGFYVPSTRHVNVDCAEIKYKFTTREVIHGDWLDFGKLPSALRLRVKVKAQKIGMPNGSGAQYIAGGREYAPYRIYRGFYKNHHKTVALKYIDQGAVQHQGGEKFVPFSHKTFKKYKLELSKTNQIFEKKFKFQNSGVTRVSTDGASVITPPGLLKGYPLWAYGGFFQPGCSLDQIGQVLFTIVKDSERVRHTAIQVSRLGYWLGKGVQSDNRPALAEGRQVMLMEGYASQELRTLEENIKVGDVSIELSYGKDEFRRPLRQIYESYDAECVDRVGQAYDIYFKKGGE